MVTFVQVLCAGTGELEVDGADADVLGRRDVGVVGGVLARVPLVVPVGGVLATIGGMSVSSGSDGLDGVLGVLDLLGPDGLLDAVQALSGTAVSRIRAAAVLRDKLAHLSIRRSVE